MSEAYEGVVFCCDEQFARHAFNSLASPLRLQLVRLGPSEFGIYRVDRSVDAFDQATIEQVALQVSNTTKLSVAVVYDNSCGVRVAVVYANGYRGREFGDADEWWVPLDDIGNPVVGGPQFRDTELLPDQEYDCIHTAIDAGLNAVGAGAVSTATVKQAFCYDELDVLAKFPNA